MEADIKKRRSRLAMLVKRPVEIPELLIYEIMDGRLIYYKGHREVLAGRKTIEEVMGSSTLQWVLVSYFMQIMFRTLDAKKYRFASNEAGVHLNHRNNLSHDVAVHDRTALTVDKINKKYANVPARVAVEIDVKADLPNEADRNYVNRKPQNYLISAPTKQSGFFLIRSRLWWPDAPPVPG